MSTLFKIAWRNIWRNRRRTLITSASILFAVLMATFMNSIQKGAWDKMIDNVVNFYFGYAQVHENGYWDEQSIDKAFPLEDSLRELPAQIPELQRLVPRLESFALASYGASTMGVLVVGTDPATENGMTALEERLVDGRYLEGDRPEVLIAEGVGKNLKLTVGDTLVLISQGYHGVNAAGKYPIVGIVRFGSPELNKQMAYLPLPVAQQFYGANGLVTSLALQIADQDAVNEVVKATKERIGDEEYEVMKWQEMLPDLVQAKEVDTAGNYIILLILYVIIAFGIFGTILMMTKEREYEFGVLVAIGMNRWKLGLTVWLEIAMLGLIGAFAGIAASFPLVLYFHLHPLDFTEMSQEMADVYEKFGFEPIFPAAFEWDLFLNQALIVLLITTVLAFYPAFKIYRLQAVKAMRGEGV